jgi:two-component system chemotaxis response regulator CheB
LSGALNDGTAGLDAIKRMNGIVVVQDPGTALYPSMPSSAARHVAVDHLVLPDELPGLMQELVRRPAGKMPDVPLDIRLESAIAAQELADMDTQDKLGVPSRFTCPECHGALWELADDSLLRYRCHTGHAYTAEAVVAAQSAEIDELLDNLFRSHRERAALTHRMAEQNRSCERYALADQLETRAQQYDSDAELIRRLMMQTNRAVVPMADIDERVNE